MTIEIDKQVVKLFIKRLDEMGRMERNVVAINQYTSYDISENEAYTSFDKVNSDRFIWYHQFSDNCISGAYEPFLEFIKKSVSELNINEKEMYDACQVIFPHRYMFDSFFKTGFFRRKEFLIYNEAEYEKKALENALMLMMKYVTAKRPTMFVLNKIHMAGISTIELIKTLLEDGNENMAFFLSYDNTYRIPDYEYETWVALMGLLQENEAIIEWYGGKSKNRQFNQFNSDVAILDQYYKELSNMNSCFLFEQANFYLQKVDRILLHEKDKIKIDTLYNIYSVFTLISIFTGKIGNAILYCNEINLLKNMEKCNLYMKDVVEFSHYFLLGYTQMYNEQEKDARDSASKCIEKAKKSNDEKRIFFGELLDHMCRYSGWKNNVWLGEENTEFDEMLIEKAEKYEFYNHLAHIHVYGFENNVDLFKSKKPIEEKFVHWKLGIDIARKLENNKFILDACRKVIMLASTSGYFTVSDYIYINYSTPVALSTNNIFEEANIYNGLGFNKSMDGNYIKANEYYNKALNIFMDIKRHEFVSETLYNMAINCIKAKDYYSGDVYISTCMKILNLLRTDKMRVCHISKLYGLKALCSYMTGNMYTAENFLKKSKQYLHSILEIPADDTYMKYWRDDAFLYNFVSLCVYLQKGKTEEARPYYEKACQFTLNGGTFSDLIYDTESLSDFIRVMNEKKSHIYSGKNLGIEKYTTKEIFEVIKSATLLNDYDRLHNDIEFLITWKQLLNHLGNNVYLVVEGAAASFKNNYSVDSFILLQYTHNESVVIYNDSGVYMDKNRQNIITNYFAENPVEFFTSKFERNFDAYKNIMKAFDMDVICSFFAAPFYKNDNLDTVVIAYSRMRNTWNRQENRLFMEEENVQLYRLIFSDLLDTIEKINIKNEIEDKRVIEQKYMEVQGLNEKLSYIVNFDRLTGLYNRQGLYDKVDEYETAGVKDIYLAYVDLDNFKYYNDHFGHDVGDVILKEVADVFRESCNANDVAVRYGGDEFILMINSDCDEKAKSIATQIYDSFEKNNFFIEKVSNIIGKKVEIPDENKISCSIGIAKVEGISIKEGLSDAIKKADDTLYYIKRTTKRQCKMWDEVKDKL